MGHYLLARYRAMLSELGHQIDEKSKVLDFCCGSGEYVKAFVNEGFDVHGFEPIGGFAPHTDRFRTFGWVNPYTADRVKGMPDLSVDWAKMRLPYDNGSFDFIFSTEVLEHVSDHASVLKELARITKPGGTHIHTFPGFLQLVEPHIKVPLGGLVKCRSWYYLWLSIKRFNPWPIPDLPTIEVAKIDHWYAKGSLHYRTPVNLISTATQYFSDARFVPHLWENPKRPKWYTLTNKAVLFLRK